MRKYRRAVIIGLSTGAVGVALFFTPLGRAGEDLALYWLFTLRGPTAPPPDVVVISTHRISSRDEAASESELPRAIYARLIDQLVREGASVIVLDLAIDKPGLDAEDGKLALAIREARRVVLFQYTERDSFDWGSTVRLVPPLQPLAEGAVGIAPHTLPKIPSRLSQVWAFMPAAGGVPTLPVVALQAHALDSLARFVALLREVGFETAAALPDDRYLVKDAVELRKMMQVLRSGFSADPDRAKRLLDALARDEGFSREERRAWVALTRLYAGNNSHFLNFYGPPGTIRTIPHHQLLEPAGSGSMKFDLNGKVVFVGMSDVRSVEQIDSYLTVYSTNEGIDVSGVEIAATAFGNFLTDRTVRPANLWIVVGVLWGFGFLLALVGNVPSVLGAAVARLALGGCFFASAQMLFQEHNLWLPLFVPLVIQIPLAVLLGLLSRSIIARRVTAYFLPDKLARQLENGVAPAAATELVYGTCLATDAEEYTTVSEKMDPHALAGLMNEYFAELGNRVVRHGGDISEVTADSMMCTWTAPLENRTLRREACLAALEIVEAVAGFNRAHDLEKQLPTRIGLHSGQLVLGNVGACGHFAYQVVGDIANTASRIQGLCKHVGTRILASEVVVAGLDELLVRRLGVFKLVGKAKVLTIFEILGQRRDVGEIELNHCETFAAALGSFESGRWEEAGRSFDAILSCDPSDGPARFYSRRCQINQTSPPSGETQFIELDTK